MASGDVVLIVNNVGPTKIDMEQTGQNSVQVDYTLAPTILSGWGGITSTNPSVVITGNPVTFNALPVSFGLTYQGSTSGTVGDPPDLGGFDTAVFDRNKLYKITITEV